MTAQPFPITFANLLTELNPMSLLDQAIADVNSGAYLQSVSASVLSGVVPTANGGEANCADRVALASVDVTRNTVALLTESGRQGWFQWDGSNLSTKVTADPSQAVYVPPSTNTTGASGCWVRVGGAKGPLYLTWFGAVGDLITDDTAPIQRGLNLAYSLKTVLIINGQYRQNGQVTLPAYVRMTGVGDTQTIYGDLANRASLIETYHQYPYVGANGENTATTLKAEIQNITWINRAVSATLFRSVVFASSLVQQNLIHRYSTVIYGGLTSVSTWKDNFCIGIGGTGFDGPSMDYFTFVDSSIVGGYMNGDPTKNATLFKIGGLVSRAAITGSYIDFFKQVELITGAAGTEFIRISNCTIEYSWRVVKSPNAGHFSSHTFIGNTFTAISASVALPFFPNADTDMTTTEWCVIEANGANRFVYEANTHLNVTRVLKEDVASYPNWAIKSRNNVYSDTAAVLDPSTMFIFNFTKSGSAVDLKDIFIEELNNIRVTNLPVASLTGTNSNTFDKQQVLFESLPLFNNAGRWYLMSGIYYDASVISGVGDSTGFFTWGTNQATGTGYWVATSLATPPATTQIRNGQNEAGAAAPSSGNVAVTTTGAQPTVVPGAGTMVPGQAYYIHMIHINAAGYISRIASGNGFVAP